MSRRWPAVIASGAAFALVGATAWFLFHDDLRRDARLREARTRTTAVARDDEKTAAARSEEQRFAAAVDAAPADSPTLAADLEQSLAASALPISAGPADGVVVTVVDRATRAPRPDVPVIAVAAAHEKAATIWQQRLDPKWLRRKHATALRSDPQGQLRVAPPVRGALLLAEVRGERGVLFVPAASTTPATLEIGSPLELAVRVIDGTGAGRSGIPVGVAKRDHSISAEAGVRAFTDETGLAMLRDLDLELNGRASTGKWWVGFAFPSGAAKGRAVELTGAAPVVELDLPPTGSLAFQVVGAGGEALHVAGKATLDVRRIRHPDGESKASTRSEAYEVAIGADGSSSVDDVGLGLCFRGEALLAGRKPAHFDAVGPARAGERVTIAIPAGIAGPTVAGRAFDAAMAPLPEAELVAEVACRDAPPIAGEAKVSARTDEEGRFVFDLSKADVGERAGPAVVTIARRGGRTTAASARIELASGALAAGDAAVDLGEVVLADLPQLCSGKVVDDRGEVVDGATVALASRDAGGHAGGTATSVWCRSHSNGRFELCGPPPTAPRAVTASARGYLSAPPVEFREGASDLELVLTRAGAIVGSITLPDHIGSRRFGAWLRRADAPETAAAEPGERATIGTAGGFRWGELAPGTWAVRIGLGDASDPKAPVVDVSGIEVKAGETTQDERLTGVDVARRLRLLIVDVRDADGAPVKGGSVATVANGAVPRIESRLRHGCALLASPSDDFEVDVLAPGFQPRRVKAQPGPLTVVLEPGIPIHVIAPLDHPRDANLVLGGIRLLPAAADAADHAAAIRVQVGAAGEADAVVPRSGKYLAELEYRRRDTTERDRGSGWSDVLSVSCEILEKPGPQVLTLTPRK